MNFEDRLLVALKEEVTERASRVPAPRPRRSVGRRVAIATTAAAAGAAAVALATMPQTASSPVADFTLTANSDGSITVSIRDLHHPDDVVARLQAELTASGVRSDIKALPADQTCLYDPGEPFTSRDIDPIRDNDLWASQDERPLVMTIEPASIEPDQTLVVRIMFDPAAPPGAGPVAATIYKVDRHEPCIVVNRPPA